MKKYILSLSFVILFLSYSMAQDKTILEKRADNEQINQIPKTRKGLRDSTYMYYVEDIKALNNTAFYNNTVLNNYFKEVINSYAISTGDVSFNEYFLNASTSEKTLTLGGSFRVDNAFKYSEVQRDAIKKIKPIQKLGNIVSISVRSDFSNGFANLYSKDSETEEFNFNSNIGVGVTYTHVFNGIFGKAETEKIKHIRKTYVKKDIEKKIKKYVDETFDKELDIDNYGETEELEKKKNEKNLIETKFFEFYKDILDEELKYAKEAHLIRRSHLFWISANIFVPVTGREVNYATDSLTVNNATFNDLRGEITGNYLLSGYDDIFKESSIKGTIRGAVFNTNTFIANNSSAKNFQEIIQTNGNTFVEGDSKSVFLGDYNEFVATSVKGELVGLFFNNTIGLSGAVEWIFGEVDNTNWKLGIPMSFKDKEGKPSFNFELQWRELNTSHFVGISVGYNFGKFVK